MDIIILGSGGQADEAESFLPDGVRASFNAVDPEFIDGANLTHRIDINAPHDSETIATAAVGAPGLRKELVEKWGGNSNYYSIQAGSSEVAESSTVEDGCIVAPGVIVTTNIRIGMHTIINTAATIGHNCDIGEYVTISPVVNVAGNVRIGDGVFVGIGAVISSGVKVAAGSVVGAGAVVVDDVVEKNSLVVGVPAKPVRVNKGWLHEI